MTEFVLNIIKIGEKRGMEDVKLFPKTLEVINKYCVVLK